MKSVKKPKQRLSEFKRTVKAASSSKWDAIRIAFDLLYCKARFKVNNDEYLKYEFYNLKNRYRKNFLLVYHQTHRYINITTRFFTRSKYILYKRIPDLFSRGMLLLPHQGEDAFVEFLKQHKKVILKPDLGSLGRCIKVLEYTNDDAARKLFKEFSVESPTICEEYIRQHPSLNEMNPFSVNTIRIVTILDNNNVEIIAAVLKTGGAVNKIVDNMHNGGIGAQVDIQTGIVTTHGRNYQLNSYVCHPISGKRFIGYHIPNWENVTELAKEAHRRLPQCLIYGWDIAVTENGAEIVEANNAPGPLLMQTMDRVPKGKKVIKMMKTIKIPQKYSKSDTYKPEYDF